MLCANCSVQVGLRKLLYASCTVQVALRKLLRASCSGKLVPASGSLQVALCKLRSLQVALCKLLCASCSVQVALRKLLCASCSRQGALRKLVGANFAISAVLARPSAGIGAVEVQKPMVFCDFCGARATLCEDRRGRGAKTHGFLRFLRCSRTAGIGVVEVQKLEVFCDFCCSNWSSGVVSWFARLLPEPAGRGFDSFLVRGRMQLAFYSNLREQVRNRKKPWFFAPRPRRSPQRVAREL